MKGGALVKGSLQLASSHTLLDGGNAFSLGAHSPGFLPPCSKRAAAPELCIAVDRYHEQPAQAHMHLRMAHSQHALANDPVVIVPWCQLRSTDTSCP